MIYRDHTGKQIERGRPFEGKAGEHIVHGTAKDWHRGAERLAYLGVTIENDPEPEAEPVELPIEEQVAQIQAQLKARIEQSFPQWMREEAARTVMSLLNQSRSRELTDAEEDKLERISQANAMIDGLKAEVEQRISDLYASSILARKNGE